MDATTWPGQGPSNRVQGRKALLMPGLGVCMIQFLFPRDQRAQKERDRYELLEMAFRYGALTGKLLSERASDNTLSRRNRRHWSRLLKLWQQQPQAKWIAESGLPASGVGRQDNGEAGEGRSASSI